jgi:hypothetical protein
MVANSEYLQIARQPVPEAPGFVSWVGALGLVLIIAGTAWVVARA